MQAAAGRERKGRGRRMVAMFGITLPCVDGVKDRQTASQTSADDEQQMLFVSDSVMHE